MTEPRGPFDFWRTVAEGRHAWRDKLERAAAHKALDIPEADDMGIAVTTRRGLGWPELLTLGGVALGGFYLARPLLAPSVPTAPPAIPPAIAQPAEPAAIRPGFVSFLEWEPAPNGNQPTPDRNPGDVAPRRP